MRFASAAVSPCDVMGQRQTALNDYFALTSVPDRPRFKGVQVGGTSPPPLRTRLLAQPPDTPTAVIDHAARAEPGERRVPRLLPAETNRRCDVIRPRAGSRRRAE